jgi:hypothetical protein
VANYSNDLIVSLYDILNEEESFMLAFMVTLPPGPTLISVLPDAFACPFKIAE